MSDNKDKIECAHCAYENICLEKDPEINKAQLGCNKFINYFKLNDYLTKDNINVINKKQKRISGILGRRSRFFRL